jgi:ferric-dicitrate binding protein FerR (iron transport regulator)
MGSETSRALEAFYDEKPVMKSSTILMRRIGGGLWPADDKAAALIRRLRPETPVAVRVLRHRSPEQAALYWRVLGVIMATGKWRTAEELHAALKVATGHVDSVRLVDGRRVLVPQSTAFDQMTEAEASAYYDAALRVVCDEIMGGMSIDDLLMSAAA